MSKDNEPEVDDLRYEIEDLRSQLESKQEELDTQVAEASAAREEIEQLNDRVSDLKAEIDDLHKEVEEKSVACELDADSIGLKWLYENCSSFTISYSRDSGRISVNGVCDSDQAGLVQQYTPRIYRENGKPPYLISEGDTYTRTRKVSLSYVSMDETLAQAVEQIIVTYCPGPVVVETQPFQTSKVADYGVAKLWVMTTDRGDFDDLKEVHCY